MLSARTLLGAALIAALSSSLLNAQSSAATAYDAVDTRIGTDGGGNTFPGATLPFGMLQWSPDTNKDAWYHDNENTILGFSLTHISGAGCPLYGDFGILPIADELQSSPGSAFEKYALPFDRAKEEMHPGYYSVTLSNGVRVELTVTDRSGIARFTFPEGKPARLIVNSGSSANEFINGGKPASGYSNEITLGGSQSFSAAASAGHFCGTDSHYRVFASGIFNKPFAKSAMWQDDSVIASAKSARGRKTGAWLDFGNQREVLLKVGISFTSEEAAHNNLDHEITSWNFDDARAKAKSAWTAVLDRIAVEGGTAEERTKFYTGVYHSLLSPNLFSDTDGRYMGFDHVVHTVSKGQTAQYANFSDWDTYRNTVQFQSLFFPERVSDMAQSLVNDAEQSGQLPRWEAANDVTYVMGGDSPAPLIASAYAFGATRFDAPTALKYMVKAGTEIANNRERPFLTDLRKLGYIPIEKDTTGASRTLEYASDDFAVAQLAKALGKEETTKQFLAYSREWKNLLDPETHWIRPRNADGTWLQGFDAEKSQPRRGNVPVPTDQLGFEEGNTWQYSFMVPYDYPALFAAMGGESQVLPRLDRFFAKLRCWGEPCFNIENEPDFVAPYAYVFAGQPWKTQQVVQRIAKETFKNTADGIPGNDDLGATSGVLVWNALGLYPAVPGVGGFVLGTPTFDRATLKLAEGKTLEITRKGESFYVHDVTFNRQHNANNWLNLSQIETGINRLEFSTQTAPDMQRGASEGERPPSFR